MLAIVDTFSGYHKVPHLTLGVGDQEIHGYESQSNQKWVSFVYSFTDHLLNNVMQLSLSQDPSHSADRAPLQRLLF